MPQPLIATPLASYSCLVRLRNGSSGPPLFVVPGLGGTIEGLLLLSDLLDIPVPVLAIQAAGVDGSEPPDSDVGAMAARYLAEVRRIQPSGPYLLCGHSFGGLVAYEMARRLSGEGAGIAALLLLDTPMHQAFWPRSYFVRVMAGRLGHHLAVMRRMPSPEAARYIVRTAGFMLKKIAGLFGRIDFAVSEEDELTPALRKVLDGGRVAIAGYRPPSYPGEVVYFAAQIPGPVTLDPDILWRPRIGRIQIHRVSGGHLSMLEQPHVVPLAAGLSACIACAIDTHSSASSAG